MPEETTNKEILEAMNKFANDVQEKFNDVQEKFNDVQEKFNDVKKEIGVVKEELDNKASKEDVRNILDAVDGIAKKHANFDEGMVANQGVHDRFEARITALESKAA